MDKLCKSNPDEFQLEFSNEWGNAYIFPKKLVSIRKPKKLTQAQKKHLKNIGFGNRSNSL